MEQLELFDKPDPTEGFLDGVKVLLARMDSNPEEFGAMDTVWSRLVRKVLEDSPRAQRVFTDEEIQAVEKKLNWVYRQNFSSLVFNTLMQGGVEESSPYRTKAALTKDKFLQDANALLTKQFEQEYARQGKLNTQP